MLNGEWFSMFEFFEKKLKHRNDVLNQSFKENFSSGRPLHSLYIATAKCKKPSELIQEFNVIVDIVIFQISEIKYNLI